LQAAIAPEPTELLIALLSQPLNACSAVNEIEHGPRRRGDYLDGSVPVSDLIYLLEHLAAWSI